MSKKKNRTGRTDVHLKAQARTTDTVGLGQAFGGGNNIPAWERALKGQGKEEREERLRYTGGLTGEDLIGL